MISLPPESRICPGCNVPKPIDQFRGEHTRGKTRRKCRECFGLPEVKWHKAGPKSTLQRIPLLQSDGRIDWTPAPEGWRVAKVENQADMSEAVADLMHPDFVCRVLYLTPESRMVIPVEVFNGDIDWIVCNRPARPLIVEHLVEQLLMVPEARRPPLFMFDTQGLIPFGGQTWAQVPEILTGTHSEAVA